MGFFSIARVSRVVIASVVGTAVLLPLLRESEPPPETEAVSTDLGSSAATPDPGRSSLRLRITVGGRQGFVDGNGRVAIAPTFAMAMPFSEGLAAVAECSDGGRLTTWRFINDQGNVVIARVFNGVRIGTFHEGMAALCSNGKFGFINTTGQVVIPAQYDEVDDFHEGLAAFRSGNKWGVIDNRGVVRLPPTFDSIGSFSSQRAVMQVDDHYGYVDAWGHVIVPPTYDSAEAFSEGLASVRMRIPGTRDAWTSYISTDGKTAIPPAHVWGNSFHEGLAAVRSGSLLYFIDATGMPTLRPTDVQGIGNFSGGMASVLRHGEYGFINRSGAIAIAPQWAFVSDFQHGIAKVNTDTVHGYIDTAGQYVWKLMIH